MRKIEVCCTSLDDIIEAHAGGAVRVEICSGIVCGGVTPGPGLLSLAVGGEFRDRIAADSNERPSCCGELACNVLIRPREGSFCYTPDEIRTMEEDITFCRKAGFDGVVIGALTPDGDIDMEACSRLVRAAGNMSVTFSRAFDVCREPEEALEKVIELGCDRLLTSGCAPHAISGTDLISRLVARAADRIVIMPGSGINPSNISELERMTHAREYHSTARKPVPDSALRVVPSLGFDEQPVPGPVSGSRYILRTSRDVVRALADI